MLIPLSLAAPTSAEATRTPVEKAKPATTPATAPVFPNGFRDVHAMNDAAEALHSLTRSQGGGDTVEAKVRKGVFVYTPFGGIANQYLQWTLY